ncbi:MAG: hypothetical protein HY271_16240 [Deltaproteobacteria bacterium]|nr:hypothetical protein [Deltaproteobacteria bacterium]
MNKRRRLATFAVFTSLLLPAAGCPPPASRSDSPAPATGASAAANEAADRGMYRPVAYRNADRPGPAIVVIEGNIKSNNATFTQKVTSNNIADYGELELSKANFKVLERSDLGALKREFQIAYTAGDPDAARKLLAKGKFKATRWVMRFDILKAEPVAASHQGFSGQTAGAIAGAFIGGRAGYATDVGVGSVQTSDSAGVWIVGMRYTLIDARTTEQAATGYFEQKMEVGSRSRAVLGASRTDEGGLTLDSLTQRLVQESVAEIDAKYK